MRFSVFLVFIFWSLFLQSQPLTEGKWRFRNAKDPQWYTCSKPDVFAALLENHLIPDPFYGTNESAVQWVEQENWVFETVLNADAIDELEFKGLDTYASIYLNNEFLFEANNAFKTWNYPSVYLKAQKGADTLRIEFFSPILKDEAKAAQLSFVYPADSDKHPKKTSVFTRKPAYHFGWDFAPRLVNSRLQELVIHSKESIRISHLDYKLLDKTTVEVLVNVRAERSGEVTLKLEIDSLASPIFKRVQLKLGDNKLRFELPIREPKLWYPNGLGDQQLYNLQLSCIQRKKHWVKSGPIGFKNFIVVQKPDEYGESFRFEINGKPMFAKGFNYIQTEKDISEEEVKEWQQMGVNTIRVWGGANYGSDQLYELCDRYGILVWQDFMFANTMYPGDRDFLENVNQEAEQQINRLKNHPSLALWCGNNEIEVAWKNWGWQQTYAYSSTDSLLLISAYQQLFQHQLPAMVNQFDSGRFYLSSSPISNWGKAEDFTHGDNHFWGVYHGEFPITAYNDFAPRFVSEYGMQSYPSMNTLAQYVGKEDLQIDNPAVKARQKSYKGNGLLMKYIAQQYTAPISLGDFVLKTQLVHANAMKTAIEAHRRNPKCAGSLVWQYNDTWPGASWSLVDYGGVKKLAWYAVKKAFQPNIISLVKTAENIEIWGVLDGTVPTSANLKLVFRDTQGANIREETVPVSPLKSGSQLLLKLPLPNFAGSIHVELMDGQSRVAENELFF